MRVIRPLQIPTKSHLRPFEVLVELLQTAIDNGGIVDQQVATDINRLAQEDDLRA